MPTPYNPLVMPTLGTVNGQPTFGTVGTYVSQTASAVNAAAQSFLTALADLGAIDYSQVGDLPAFNSVVWLGSTVGIMDRPTRPTMTLGNIQSLLDRLNQLVPPSLDAEDFVYSEPGYSSALRDPMINKLLNDLTNGGYGIDTTDEVALWNRARDREAKQGVTNVLELRRQAAATSAPMPQGALQVALNKLNQDSADRISGTNREIALKRADLYVEQRRRVIDQVLSSENQSIELYNAVQNRTLQVAQIRVQMSIALFDASVKLFAVQQQAITTAIDAQLETLKATISVYASDVAAYAAFVNAVASGAQVDIANSRTVLERDMAAHRSRTDIIKFRLQELGLTLEKNKEIYKYGTDFFRTSLGSALNGINGLAVQTGES
jgi:hypothetical protein